METPTQEELNKQLALQVDIAEALRDDDPGLGWVTAFVMAGDRLSTDKAKKAIAEGTPWLEASQMVGSYARMDFVLWAARMGAAPMDEVLENLPHLWVGSDPDDTNVEFLNLWMFAKHTAGHMITDGENLPEQPTIRIYRGQRKNQPLGISWSTNRDIADKFGMSGGTREKVADGTVICTVVRTENVLAYLTGRGESEVILDPAGLLLPAEEDESE